MAPTANEIYRLFEEYRRKRTAADAASALAASAAERASHHDRPRDHAEADSAHRHATKKQEAAKQIAMAIRIALFEEYKPAPAVTTSTTAGDPDAEAQQPASHADIVSALAQAVSAADRFPAMAQAARSPLAASLAASAERMHPWKPPYAEDNSIWRRPDAALFQPYTGDPTMTDQHPTAADAAAALAKFAALVTSDTPAGEAANRRLADEIMQAYDAAAAAIPLAFDATGRPAEYLTGDPAIQIQPLAEKTYTVTVDTAEATAEIAKLQEEIASAREEAAAALPKGQPGRPPTHPIALEIASNLAAAMAKEPNTRSLVPSEPTARRAAILAAFAAMASAEAAAASAANLARIAEAAEEIAEAITDAIDLADLARSKQPRRP